MRNRALFCLVLGALLLTAAVRPAAASLVSNLVNGSNEFKDNSVAYVTDSSGNILALARNRYR